MKAASPSQGLAPRPAMASMTSSEGAKHRMKLRLGQRVEASDGDFGELADIVIDPQLRAVTHLVVQPLEQRLQSRLVPLWLVSVEDDVVKIGLDLRRVRQLQRVTFADFVPVDSGLSLGDKWGVGIEDVVSMPYRDAIARGAPFGARSTYSYDRIPKGECEIRRSSVVFTINGYPVGRVDGFLAEEKDLTAVVVRWGPLGFRHEVLVPMEVVRFVENDCIGLSIDRTEFYRLPSAIEFGAPAANQTRVERLESRAGAAARHVLSKMGPVIRRLTRVRPLTKRPWRRTWSR